MPAGDARGAGRPRQVRRLGRLGAREQHLPRPARGLPRGLGADWQRPQGDPESRGLRRCPSLEAQRPLHLEDRHRRDLRCHQAPRLRGRADPRARLGGRPLHWTPAGRGGGAEPLHRRRARTEAASQGLIPRFEIVAGHPANQIVYRAEQNGVDLIVVGHRGRSFFERLLVGSVSKQSVFRRWLFSLSNDSRSVAVRGHFGNLFYDSTRALQSII
ncbi:MAG: universal stress protein [Gammaproteobacteria bacterium]|nr:universal stress protein [Gammaproteobacteria bacterium]